MARLTVKMVLGKEHPYTLSSMNNLALVLNEQGKYEEAEIMHREELKLCQKIRGKEHPSTKRVDQQWQLHFDGLKGFGHLMHIRVEFVKSFHDLDPKVYKLNNCRDETHDRKRFGHLWRTIS